VGEVGEEREGEVVGKGAHVQGMLRGEGCVCLCVYVCVRVCV
jgi:hypothetical protein